MRGPPVSCRSMVILVDYAAVSTCSTHADPRGTGASHEIFGAACQLPYPHRRCIRSCTDATTFPHISRGRLPAMAASEPALRGAASSSSASASPGSTPGMCSPPAVRFILTGFGPFPGVPRNPAQAVASQLQVLRPDVSLCLPMIEVSPKAVSIAASAAYAAAIAVRQAGHADVVVVLHLGVAARSPGIRIERQARNIQAFSVPAADGSIPPQNTCISERLPLGGTLSSALPVDDIVAQAEASMATALPGDNAVRVWASEDAGTYLCNMLYWHTLCALYAAPLQRQQQQAGLSALFVHIPSEHTAPVDRIVTAVACIMDAVVAAVAAASGHCEPPKLSAPDQAELAELTASID